MGSSFLAGAGCRGFGRGCLALLLALGFWAALSGAALPSLSSPALASSGVSVDAAGARKGKLVVKVKGLPKGTRPVGKVRGRGLVRSLRSGKLTIARARPGRYVVTLRRAKIARRFKSVRKGARALPLTKRFAVRVKARKTTVASARYGTVVNPGVQKAPRGLLSVVGSPSSPKALIYRNRRGLPRRGAILVGGPSAKLPRGLVVKVSGTRRRHSKRVLTVRAISITAAVPAFDFKGARKLKAMRSRTRSSSSARAAAKRKCDGPKDFDIGARLDDFTLRRASATPWPPQMSLTMAIRTTEHFGAKAAAAGVACSWALAELGPWSGAIPTPVPGLFIPVFASIPVQANASVEGSLSAFRVNLASTSVINVDLGRHSAVSASQEGSHVWVDGVLKGSGTASLSGSLGVKAGVGNPKAGDFHLKSTIGPKLSFNSGTGCKLGVDFGTLSAGVKAGKFAFDTPSFTPFTWHIWDGCKAGGNLPGSGKPPGSGSGPGPGGGGGPGPGGGPATARGPANAIAAGTYHSCALYATTRVACWGTMYGEVPRNNAPVPVQGLNDAAAVTAGYGHACALRQDGHVACWGYSRGEGELGDGSDTTSDVPVAVKGLTDAIAVDADRHTCAVREGGEISCWGRNVRGQLGDGSNDDRKVPVEVQGLSDATAIAAGNEHSCALRQNGRVACWGRNDDGRLGDGSTDDSNVPVAVQGLSDAIAITAGSTHSCALRSGGTVVCWGGNGNGQLGNGSTDDTNIPVPVRGLSDATAVTADIHSCALRHDGTAACWGYNENGQVGNGSTANKVTVPVAVQGLSNATAVAAGSYHTCALRQGGALVCVGANYYGELGNGSNDGSLVLVSVRGFE